jgi:hypothetical protein
MTRPGPRSYCKTPGCGRFHDRRNKMRLCWPCWDALHRERPSDIEPDLYAQVHRLDAKLFPFGLPQHPGRMYATTTMKGE